MKQQLCLSDFFKDYTPIRNENVYLTSISRNDFNNTKERKQPRKSFQEINKQTSNQEGPATHLRHISLHLMRNISRNPHEHCIHVDDSQSHVLKVAESDKALKSKEITSIGELATVESTSKSKTTISSSKQSSNLTSGRQHGGKSN